MKRFLLSLFALCGAVAAATAQEEPLKLPEPEFIGEIVTVRPDGTVAKLEKQSVQMRTRANASAVIFGIGKAKTKLIIEGPKAGVRLTAGQPASFIVRAVDNATDPMSIINVFRFEAKKDKRMAEMASVSSFGSVIALLGFAFGLLLVVLRLAFGPQWAAEGVFMLFAVLFMFIGAQFVGMGLLGEYIGRIYNDVRARPRYFIQRVVRQPETASQEEDRS